MTTMSSTKWIARGRERQGDRRLTEKPIRNSVWGAESSGIISAYRRTNHALSLNCIELVWLLAYFDDLHFSLGHSYVKFDSFSA